MYTHNLAKNLGILFLLLTLTYVGGCSVVLEEIKNYGLVQVTDKNDTIPVTYGIQDDIRRTNTLRLYIEGDGRGWVSKYRPSIDPTPSNSLVLKLMQADTVPSAYLARPCQYVLNNNCIEHYWTEGRHAEELVTAMNNTISNIKEQYQAKNIELVGHSGGGTMAVLIAARRLDVKKIITIAANLDVESFTKHHKVTPMKGSLSPIDFVDDVKHIPQIHLAGGKDKTVPPHLIKKFVRKAASDCVHYKEYSTYEHHKGWLSVWPSIIKGEVSCKN